MDLIQKVMTPRQGLEAHHLGTPIVGDQFVLNLRCWSQAFLLLQLVVWPRNTPSDFSGILNNVRIRSTSHAERTSDPRSCVARKPSRCYEDAHKKPGTWPSLVIIHSIRREAAAALLPVGLCSGVRWRTRHGIPILYEWQPAGPRGTC